MAKVYRTAQGKQLDIEKLRLQNELVPAIGNMRVNARGDQLGPGGKVVKSREQMVDDHYKVNPRKNKSAAADDIPTKGGKSKKVESFEPGKIEPDLVHTQNTAPVEDNFVDPEVSTDLPAPDPVTGIAAGEKAIKGGLARAVAKTKAAEKEKNKPKRL